MQIEKLHVVVVENLVQRPWRVECGRCVLASELVAPIKYVVLNEMDLWRDTVIVFTADHGEMGGAHIWRRLWSQCAQ